MARILKASHAVFRALAAPVLTAAVLVLVASTAIAVVTPQAAQQWIGGYGYARMTATAASIPTTANGTALVSTALAYRHKVCAYLLPAVTATLYIGTGNVSATQMIASITGGQQWCDYLGDGIAVKALSSSGTLAVYVSEYGGPQ